MYRVYLLLGSNMGDRKAVMEQATIELIDALLPDYLEIGSLGEAVNTSQMYETEPWGFESPDKFMNQAFCCVTELEPQQVLSECLRIEKELGRVRSGERFDTQGNRIYTSRVIDIDILIIDRQEGEKWVPIQINTPNLVVPHPRLPEREFALKPLREIRPVK
jgi:2-amino-4-hydroxy-6-hydroxymethyldihydropteridine diphosphokinase